MEKWARFLYQPGIPLGKDGKRLTGSKEHIALSKKAAAEGMVLLKNEGHLLPLAKGSRIAVFGKACADYVKGGGGSGDVTVAYVRNLLEGLVQKEREGRVNLFPKLGAFYAEEVKKQYAAGVQPGMTVEPKLPEKLLEQAAAYTDTALIAICRFSGEDWDRTVPGDGALKKNMDKENIPEYCNEVVARSSRIFERGDFYLSAAEQQLAEQVCSHFAHVVVVLNVGGMVDTSWFKENEKIQGALLAWQGGMEGGSAMADLLCGDINPSGKLTDTFANRLEDYPSSAGFHESDAYAEYTEDIYVGYRYFETMKEAKTAVNYPFGFGLSYTTFLIEENGYCADEEMIKIQVAVKNTGSVPGKEVVQFYVGAPQGKLGKPARELKAFAKTRLLEPGETQELTLTVPVAAMASYDDTGKVKKNAWVLERGEYRFYLGNSVRNLRQLSEGYFLETDQILKETGSKCAPILLKKRMLADGTYEEMKQYPQRFWELVFDEALGAFSPETVAEAPRLLWGGPKEEPVITFSDVEHGKATLEEFTAQLTDEELVRLTCGQPNTGVANTYGMGNLPKYGVPNVMTADGPAGVRINPECGVAATAFPCATLLACTWNEQLVEQVGAAGALEVKENNLGVWLTPAMNIHRSPLCGRNFEYYSEDPFVAGKMGAAMVRGIQSQKIAASPKHFCANNKETNRKNSDSRLSERALREIYLKGFEIMVKEADPWTMMSSYNAVNGCRASQCRELLTGILREEWGFQGMVTSDWWNFADQPEEILAGNDIKMGCGFPKRVLAAMKDGRLTREDIRCCAVRVLEMILKVGG